MPAVSSPFPQFVQAPAPDAARLRDALALGLLDPAAHVAPKYFYDALGSRLFEAITELPEYYPTRTEAAIFQRHAAEMAEWLGRGHTLVDLGAGNGAKAARLFSALQPRRYVAVDISVEYLRQALSALQREHPQMPMLGVGCDFSETLELPPEAGDEPRLLFYPGSSIGNFTPAQALVFLRQARRESLGGQLLIGVDLLKASDILVPAYDDPLGVTAAFNRNLLLHVNALLGSDFDVRDWQHEALFNALHARIEMHLQARHPVTVRWPGAERRFAAGERIHTENSCKYRLEDFEALLRAAGFAQLHAWTDARRWFAVLAARG
ncbi:MAG: L-histidine N(alpha)-methyltransferase [Rubrivivax sp.]|nr:L-histidine N(alpha)-methyltransferase [Rubrivivax sp.]